MKIDFEVNKLGHEKLDDNTYLVGGAVRDLMLGNEPKDLDYVVTNFTSDEIASININGEEFKQVGADFPVFLFEGDEYALTRTERKNGCGYHGFEVNSDNVPLEDDLRRRDLTINAMAFKDGKVTDPFNGVEDLKNKILRHVDEIGFKEDPLRILRVARFAARYSDFSIASDTLKMMKEMVENGEINFLTKERIWLEIEKVFLEKKSSIFFNVLEQIGALEILFPELAQLDINNFNDTLLKLNACSDILENEEFKDDSHRKTETSLVKFSVLMNQVNDEKNVFKQMEGRLGNDSKQVVKMTKLVIELEKKLKKFEELDSQETLEVFEKHFSHKHDMEKLNTILNISKAINFDKEINKDKVTELFKVLLDINAKSLDITHLKDGMKIKKEISSARLEFLKSNKR